MSDHVTIRENGQREAAFAFKPPWWDMGFKVTDHTMTSKEILQKALLDWFVEQHPVYVHRVNDTHQVRICRKSQRRQVCLDACQNARRV